MLILIRKKYEPKNQNKNKFQAFNNNNTNMTAATATVAISSRTTVARISAKCIYHRIPLIKEPQRQQQQQQEHHQVVLRQPQQHQQHIIRNTFKHLNLIVFNRCLVKACSMQIRSRRVSPVHSVIAPIVATARCGDICVKSAARVNRWSVPFAVIVPSVPIICDNM